MLRSGGGTRAAGNSWGWQLLVCCAAVVLPVVVGCGGASQVVQGTSTSDPVASTESTLPAGSTTAGSATTGSAGTTASGGAPTTRKRTVERPSGTPLGTMFPTSTPAYQLLSEGRCQELLSTINTGWQDHGTIVVFDHDGFYLYRAAAEVCLGQWSAAQADFDKMSAAKPAFKGSCDSTEECPPCKAAVLRWLTEQLGLHKSDPGFVPVYVKGTAKPPCPDAPTTTSEPTPTTTRSLKPTTTTTP